MAASRPMLLHRDPERLPEAQKGAVLALGNFDGLHRGHRAVIRTAVETAERLGTHPAVMTFEPHPRRFFKKDSPPLRLMPFRRKVMGLEQLGISTMIVMRFNAALAQMTAGDFVDLILCNALHVRHVVIGHDFIFGHNREGNAEFLREKAKSRGFAVTQVSAVQDGGAPCSSTRIRDALTQGNLAEAEAMLGHRYTLEGRVAHGDRRGRTLGFPTANLPLGRLFAPARGVYAVRAEVEGQRYDGVANLGLRPTFGGDLAPRLEVHVFDASPDLYGKHMMVEFVAFMRAEQRFNGPEALVAQIREDCIQARTVLGAEPRMRQEETTG